MTIGPVSADGCSLEQIKLLFAELDAELRRTSDAADLDVVFTNDKLEGVVSFCEAVIAAYQDALDGAKAAEQFSV